MHASCVSGVWTFEGSGATPWMVNGTEVGTQAPDAMCCPKGCLAGCWNPGPELGVEDPRKEDQSWEETQGRAVSWRSKEESFKEWTRYCC